MVKDLVLARYLKIIKMNPEKKKSPRKKLENMERCSINTNYF